MKNVSKNFYNVYIIYVCIGTTHVEEEEAQAEAEYREMPTL